MKARYQRIIATLTLAVALLAVLVGSAQAADRQGNRADSLGIGSQSKDKSDVFTRAVNRARAGQTVRPDDRAGPRGVSAIPSAPVAAPDVFERAVLRHNASTAARPDDRAGIRGIGAREANSAPTTTTKPTGTAFQWLDAGFGAGATLALILLVAGVAVVRAGRQHSHPILD